MTLSVSRTLGIAPKAKMLTVVSLTMAADFLFFDQRAGVNLAIFLTLLGVALFLSRKMAPRRTAIFTSSLLFCGMAVAALAENISWISISLTILGLSTLAVDLKLPWYRDVPAWASKSSRFVFSAPLRIFKDIRLFRKLQNRAGNTIVPGGIKTWLVPIFMTVLFSYLFALANPLMEKFFASLLVAPDTQIIPLGRVALWFSMLLMLWPFFSRHSLKPQRKTTVPAFTSAAPYTLKDRLFTPQSIIRSLVMFNILFASQLAFDFTYLLAGARLPEGMTFASYAHRGAYPLLVTVLLAALFVLVTMSKGSKTEHHRLIRTLVYVWIAQNVLLTFASIDRLWLYASAYSLTYLRVAAFVWMVLVAMGLVLILVRLWRNYPNRWLINCNMVNLVAILFICAFIDFGSQIAWFNVQQNRTIDLAYLERIGPSALPALDLLKTKRKFHNKKYEQLFDRVSERLQLRIQALSNRNWRERTLRDRRLISWLANQQATVQKKIATSKLQDK